MGKVGTMGQRKTVLFLAVLFTTAALVGATDAVTGDHYVTILSVCFPLVIAGNVAEHFAKRPTAVETEP